MAAISGPNIPQEGLVLNIDPGSNLSYPARNDPGRDNISLLLDGESLTDKSKNAVTVTVQGSVTVDSSVKKVGNSSLKFAGAKTDYLTISNSSLFNFPGDFTVEFWTYANQFGQQYGFTTYFSNEILDRFQLAIYPNNANIQLYINGSLFIQGTLSASIVGRWMHIAVVRSGTTVTIYENGVSRASGTSSYSIATTLLYIGRQVPRSPIDYAGNLDGYIDDFCITKFAKYTGSFTPPAKLSLPGQISDIKNDLVGTLTNGPAFSNVQAGVMSFDGSDDYINFDNNNNYALGSGDFAVEFLVNLNSSHQFSLIDFRINETSPNGNAFVIGTNSSNQWVVYKGGNQIIGATSVGNAWTHVVVTRIGSSIKLYLNGVQSGSTWTSTLNFSDNALLIGTDYPRNARFYNGKMGHLRIYKNRGLTSDDIKKLYSAISERYVEIPKTISGLQLWLDAADLSTLRQSSAGTTSVALVGDPIGYWADKSGNGRHATQATAGSRPSLLLSTVNNLPVINFSTTVYNSLNITNFTSSDKTIFIVHQGLSSSLDTRLFTVNSDYKLNIGASTYSGNNLSFVREYISWTNSGFSRIYNPTIFNITYTNTPSFSANISRYTSSGLSSVQTYTNTGSGSDTDRFGQTGYYCEIICYNRLLSNDESNRIKNYLNKKWGVF
jgi:hypothetical protein